MDCLLDKKGSGPLSGWSARCYRSRNCELIQYKRGIEDFKLCSDKNIKKRYNINNILSISIGPKTPYVLRVEIETPYQSDSVNLLLKFNDVNKKTLDHLVFVAWYRILISSTKVLNCQQRPLPSNICFALYYLLQKLYKHKEILNTKNIFDVNEINTKTLKKLPKNVEKLYYNLIIRSKEYLGLDQDINDINLLTQTLLYTLINMPSSLFCDSYCNELTEFVIKTIKNAQQQKYNDDKDFLSKLEIEEYEDRDIVIIKEKGYLAQIKNFLLKKYSANKVEYKKENGFHNFHRYGFMIILFLMLNKISCNKYYRTTLTSAADLAQIFGPVLLSKQYLFECRTQELQKNSKYHSKNAKTKRNKKYEENFLKMVKIMIFYAKDLFPDLQRVSWKVSTLIAFQGKERTMTRHYNDRFSKDTKNEYYIAPILSKGKNYGLFDSKYYRIKSGQQNQENEEDIDGYDGYEEEKKEGNKKYIVRVNNTAMPSHKPIVQRRVSYNQNPAYQSDLGISEIDDQAAEYSDDEDDDENYNDNDEEKYPKQAQKPTASDIDFSTDYDADVGGDTATYAIPLQQEQQTEHIAPAYDQQPEEPEEHAEHHEKQKQKQEEEEEEEEAEERGAEQDEVTYNGPAISVQQDHSHYDSHSDSNDPAKPTEDMNIAQMEDYVQDNEEKQSLLNNAKEEEKNDLMLNQQQMYMQQQSQQQIENAVDEEKTSWLDCELCFYAPLRRLFGAEEAQQQQPQPQYQGMVQMMDVNYGAVQPPPPQQVGYAQPQQRMHYAPQQYQQPPQQQYNYNRPPPQQQQQQQKQQQYEYMQP